MVLPFIALSVLLAAALPAAEYSVGPDDDMSATLARLNPGDTLVLDPEEYTQTLRLNNLKGTAAAPIVIDGHPVLVASPYARPIPGVPLERNLNGISFAVANACGVLARLLADQPEVRSATDAVELVARSGGQTRGGEPTE